MPDRARDGNSAWVTGRGGAMAHDAVPALTSWVRVLHGPVPEWASGERMVRSMCYALA
jgi:hypothetical protein